MLYLLVITVQIFSIQPQNIVVYSIKVRKGQIYDFGWLYLVLFGTTCDSICGTRVVTNMRVPICTPWELASSDSLASIFTLFSTSYESDRGFTDIFQRYASGLQHAILFLDKQRHIILLWRFSNTYRWHECCRLMFTKDMRQAGKRGCTFQTPEFP